MKRLKLKRPSVKKLSRQIRDYSLKRFAQPVLVLMYHRVDDVNQDPWSISVKPSIFEQQLVYMSRHYQFARFEDDWSALERPTIVITFDDGYRDNFTQALPILEKYNVPATFFISTGLVDSKEEFWSDALCSALLQDKVYPQFYSTKLNGETSSWPTVTFEERLKLVMHLQATLKNSEFLERELQIKQLNKWSSLNVRDLQFNTVLSLKELQALAEHPLTTIGAHTVNHSALTSMNTEKQKQEIGDSKRMLESWIGQRVTTFSYPFGLFNKESKRVCYELGFTKAAVAYNTCTYSWTNLMQIPRLHVNNWSVEELHLRLDSHF